MLFTAPMLRWIAAGIAGFTIAGAVFHFPGSFPAGSGGSEFQPGAALFGAIQGTISGAIAGALLWWSARPVASRMLIAATALGFALTHALGDGLPAGTEYAVIGLAGGAVLGLSQQRTFAAPPGALAFVIGSALGLAAGIVLGMALIDVIGLTQQSWTPALGALQHGIASAITGLLWSWATGRRLFAGRRERAAA